MAKGRMLLNRISKSKKMAELSSHVARLLYTWLLSHLDVNGNFYADPVMVNNIVFVRLSVPLKTVADALDEFDKKGLILRYQVDGETYLKYPDFLEKQPVITPSREGKPDIPDATPELLKSYSRVTPPQNKRREEKIKEEKGQKFIAPTENDVIKYFKENGYIEESAKKAFKYYNTAGWKDSRGNQVKNWKQKMIAVWFKEETKDRTSKESSKPKKEDKCKRVPFPDMTKEEVEENKKKIKDLRILTRV